MFENQQARPDSKRIWTVPKVLTMLRMALIPVYWVLMFRGRMIPALCTYLAASLTDLAAGYIAMAVIQSLAGVMRGAGDTVTPMWLSIAQTLFIRVPTAYLFCFLTRTPDLPNGRQEMLYVSLLVSWLCGAVLHVFFYKRGKWKEKSVIDPTH